MDIGSKKKLMSERTHSQPVRHWAISNWAHTPETKSEASGRSLERNLETMAERVDEGGGRGEREGKDRAV